MVHCSPDLHLLTILGQHDDARMCLAVALTASRLGANVANYVEVTKLLYRKDEDGKNIVSGATVLDKVSGNYNSHSSLSSAETDGILVLHANYNFGRFASIAIKIPLIYRNIFNFFRQNVRHQSKMCDKRDRAAHGFH